MNKKIIGVFLISLIGTLLCGVIITYPRWSVLIKNSSSKQVNETVIDEEIASNDSDTVNHYIFFQGSWQTVSVSSFSFCFPG